MSIEKKNVPFPIWREIYPKNLWGYFSDKTHIILTSPVFVVTSEILQTLSEKDFIQYLYENKISQIDVNDLEGKDLERINRILTQNFPLIETFRFMSRDQLVNINISGIKQINDIAGKRFCDILVGTLKSLIRENLQNTWKSNSYKTRIVKDDYRNLACVWKLNNPVEHFFGDLREKSQITQILLQKMQDEIEKRAHQIINEQIRLWEIETRGTYQLKAFLNQKIKEIENSIHMYFNFWISEVIIPENINETETLDILRKSEIASRSGIDEKWTISVQNYDNNDIFDRLHFTSKIKSEIIETYENTQFEFEWIPYNVVFQLNGKRKISSELLKYVRKYPEKVKPEKLVYMVQAYIKNLNLTLDYIPPIQWDIKDIEYDLQQAKHINEQVQNRIINCDFLFKTYKGWYTKEAFLSASQSKPWIRICMDIKDMWVDNIIDFDNIAELLLELQQSFENGEIDWVEFEKRQTQLFLSAGKSVTDNFREVQLRIKQSYPNSFIRFWGDEIELFLPHIDENEIPNIQANIGSILDASNQKARIMIDTTLWDDESNFAYARLDRLGKINKMVEELLEKQVYGRKKEIEDLPNKTYLRMDDYAKSLIFMPWFHLEDFLSSLWEILTNFPHYFKDKKKFLIWKWKYHIKLTLKNRPNSEIEIYLHN